MEKAELKQIVERDRREAFRMSIKAVERSYWNQRRDPVQDNMFWTDVETFFFDLQRRQENAMIQEALNNPS